MKQLGYNFTYQVLDSHTYMLPQRRNRCWGIATVISGQESEKDILDKFSRALSDMRTNFQFPLEMNFPPQEKEEPRTKHHRKAIQTAEEKTFVHSALFVDCSQTSQRPTSATDGVPCVMPKHPVYFREQERYLNGVDFLNAQGLWPCAFSDSVYAKLAENTSLAQSLAGNSFSSTVNRAVLLAALTATTSPWKMITSKHDLQASQKVGPEAVLKRIRAKRPAPEFGLPKIFKGPKQRKNEQKNAQRRRRWLERRASSKKQDARKNNKGKRPVATIWEKEQV